MCLSLEHQNILRTKYGITGPDYPGLHSATQEELQRLLGCGAEGRSGLCIEYKDVDAFSLRLWPPLPGQNGEKELKYWRPAGSCPALYVPPGLDINNFEQIIITEGELKSYRAWRGSGIACVALAGIMSRRTGEVKDDSLGLLPSLDRDWSGKNLVLIYDSDIRPGHPGYPSFVRLGLQLYN
jgi:hypothetical protein